MESKALHVLEKLLIYECTLSPLMHTYARHWEYHCSSRVAIARVSTSPALLRLSVITVHSYWFVSLQPGTEDIGMVSGNGLTHRWRRQLEVRVI